jgi:hypothetical protein
MRDAATRDAGTATAGARAQPGPYRAPACGDCGAVKPIAACGRCADCLEGALISARDLLRSARVDRRRYPSPWPVVAAVAMTLAACVGIRSRQALDAAERAEARAALAVDPPAAEDRRAISEPAEVPPVDVEPRRITYPQDTPSGPLPWPPHVLSTAGPLSDDPHELLARAEILKAAGLGVTIVHSTVSADSIAGVRTLRTVPLVQPGAGLFGFKLYSVDRALERAGLQDGDVLTAVNGRDVAHDPHALSQPVAESDLAVVEVLRGERRIVLAVHWKGA